MAQAGRNRFLKEYPTALHDGTGAMFIGAGVSIAAGYPSWSSLLREIGEELGVQAADVHDLAALAQWHINGSGAATGVRSVIKKEIGQNLPIPDAVRIMARLPVRHMWTTNYDRLIERAFEELSRPLDTVSSAEDLALRVRPGAARLYKMHGSIDRLDDVVISTDDYELFRSRRGAFLPLLQAHLSSMSLLFVGLSLTDPNVRHVLSLIRESFTTAPPEHFAIVRPPHRADFRTDDEYKARTTQHQLWAKDLRRYGFVAVEVESYDEVPVLLHRVERKVADKRVWVSGSWPLDAGDDRAAERYRLSEAIGKLVGEKGFDLVSGSGVLVGSASIAGFLDSLRFRGGWDIERRLIVRSFPQALPKTSVDRVQWTTLRTEMARQSGLVIFVGGLKLDAGREADADGVMEEFEIAMAAGAYLLPIGATGGAARRIADQLISSPISATGADARRPTDQELAELMDPGTTRDGILKIVGDVMDRVAKAI